MHRDRSRDPRAHRGSLPIASVLTTLCLACASALGVSACRERAATEQEPSRPAFDAYADGQRLAASTSQFLPRWRAVQALPDCAALLPEPEPRSQCQAVLPQIDRLRAELTRTSDTDSILPALAGVALAAEKAAQVLRDRGVQQLFEAKPAASQVSAGGGAALRAHAAGSSKPTSAELPQTRPARAPSARSPAASPPIEHAHATERAHANPVLDAITEYRRLATLALRQMAAYLEHGPLPVRQRALGEFRRLAEARPQWTDLKNLLREAELIEASPQLKQQLRSLRERLGS